MMETYLIVYAACAAALGIWMESAWQLPAVPLMAAGLFCMGLSGIFWRQKRKSLAFIFFLAFVLAGGMARMDLADEHWRAQSRDMAGAEGMFQGVVSGGSSISEGETRYLRYPVELSQVTYKDGSPHPLHGAVYLYIPWDGETKPIPIDQRLTIRGELSHIRLYQNPGKMDLERRYQSQRLIGRIYAASPKDVEIGGPAGEYPLSAWAESIKQTIRDRFSPYMDKGRLPLLMTLLFGGNYDELPPGVLDSFTATGIVHILSVSGSHVALLFGFLVLLGSWLSVPRRIILPIAAFVILFYGALSGFVPPVIRASVMGVLSVMGLFFGREKESVLLLGAAVLGMLLWEPRYLFDVSFQLSVGASAGILLFYPKLAKEIRRLPHMPRWVAEGTALALAAQVLTVPIILYDFHVLPLYFVPANLFITPLLEWTIILGLAAALLVSVIAPLAGGLLQLADYFLWAAIRGNGVLSALPHAVLPLGGMAAGEAALYYGAVFLASTRKWWRAYRWGKEMAGGAAACLLLWNGWLWWTQPAVEYFVPDLGASRGAVLHGRGPTVVYYKDGGLPFDIGNRELRSVLAYKGLFSVDIFIAEFSAGRGPAPFTLSVPIREIWVMEKGRPAASAFLNDHPESRVRTIKKGHWQGTDGTLYLCDGRNWAIVREGFGYFFDSGEPWKGNQLRADRWIWFGGTGGFQSGVNDDTIQTLQPKLALYAGSRLPAAGEDKEKLELLGIPVMDTYERGMVEVGVRGEDVRVETFIKES